MVTTDTPDNLEVSQLPVPPIPEVPPGVGAEIGITDEFSIEGQSSLQPEAWHDVCLTDESGADITKCDTLEEAQAVVEELRLLIAAEPKCSHWEYLRIVHTERRVLLAHVPVKVAQ